MQCYHNRPICTAQPLPRLTFKLPAHCFLALLSVSSIAAHPQDAANPYESAIRQGLKEVYLQHYEDARSIFGRLSSLHNYPPAPAVYLELTDSWETAADPGNVRLLAAFDKDSKAAIDVCLDWTKAHPDDPEGWRYRASAYGQVSLFKATILTGNWNKFSAVRAGSKMHDAILRAQKLEGRNLNPDTDLGLGSFAYFTAKIPAPVEVASRLFLGITRGDAEDGIKRMTNAMRNGPHMKTEAAMALAGAFYSSADYPQFQSVLNENILNLYPNQLSVRTWQVSGYICANDARNALPAIEGLPATATDDTWRNFQRGRVALALGDRTDAERLFTDAIRSFDRNSKFANGSILTWSFFGLELARGSTSPESKVRAAQIDHPDIEPDAIPLAQHIFFPPGECPKH